MKHIVRVRQGHDCIRFECVADDAACRPGAGGSHGVHGANILFVAQGDQGAVQFLLYTGWLPQCEELDGSGSRFVPKWSESGPLPADLGYHSRKPRYKGQPKQTESCEYCNGEPCYYDGSGLNANDAMYALVNGGDDALWTFLDAYYERVFGDGEYPKPAEYHKPLRVKEGV